MATIEWPKWNIFILTICLLIGWNYWAPLAVLQPASTREAPWVLYGVNSLDLHIFYEAGRLWRLQGNPYDVKGFVYPPTSIPFFGVFALFDFRLASQLWAATYFSLFAVALLALALSIKGERRYVYGSIAVLLFLTSYPLLIMMHLGQSDLLVASLAILSLACERLKHRSTSAVMLSFATLLKGPAVLLLIYFVIFRKDFGYPARFLVSSLAIVGASLFVIPIGLYWYYIVNVLPILSTSVALESNQSITGLISLARMTWITPAVSFVGYVLFGFFRFGLVQRKRPSGGEGSVPMGCS